MARYPIAFLVLAHTEPGQVKRLVGALGGHDVYLHVDGKVPLTDEWRATGARLVEDRVNVSWAGYSSIVATARLLAAAKASGREYGRIVLLSGSCYPIKPADDLEALFASDGGLNYIRYVAVRDSAHLRTLIERTHFQDSWLAPSLARIKLFSVADRAMRKIAGKLASLFPTKWLASLEPYHGHALWALTPEAAWHALDRITDDPVIARAYRRAFASDEQVFHTIIGNSHFATHSTGLMPFTGRGTYKAANLHVIDNSLTKWYALDDYDDLIASDRFFVRKVRPSSSDALLDALDARIAADI